MSHAMICNSKNAPVPVADYSHAVKVPLNENKSLLYLCGMGPRDKETNKVPGVTFSQAGDILDYNIKLQTQNVFKNGSNQFQNLEHSEGGTSYL